MTVIKPIGNTITANASTGNVVSCYSNGSTAVYALNGSTGVANVTIGSNSSVNTANIPIAANQWIIIVKAATDLLYGSNTLLTFTPVAKVAD